MTTDQNIADRLEERPAVIKGEGFNPSGGGFARIIVDGVAYTPEQVRSALQSQAAEIEREKRSSDMWAAEVKAAHARIAELENERDEARLEELRIWTFLGKPDLSKQRLSDHVKARLKDAVKVIEPFARYAKRELDKEIPRHIQDDPTTPALGSGNPYDNTDAVEITIADFQNVVAFLSTTGGDNG